MVDWGERAHTLVLAIRDLLVEAEDNAEADMDADGGLSRDCLANISELVTEYLADFEAQSGRVRQYPDC